jgi:hypothetical protein
MLLLSRVSDSNASPVGWSEAVATSERIRAGLQPDAVARGHHHASLIRRP